MNINKISERLQNFVELRDWAKFHTPKNLVMALAVEASELLEIFQWLTEEESKEIVKDEKNIKLIREEIADVLIYLIYLADKFQIDLEEAVYEKIKTNEGKYPIEIFKGSAKKQNRL